MTGEPVDPFPSDAELVPRLAELAKYRATLEHPGFRFGEWAPSAVAADGVITLGWFEFSAEASGFLRAASAAGCVVPFDWPAWLDTPAAQALLADRAAVAAASPGDLVRLMTALVRGDRFGEGTLA